MADVRRCVSWNLGAEEYARVQKILFSLQMGKIASQIAHRRNLFVRRRSDVFRYGGNVISRYESFAFVGVLMQFLNSGLIFLFVFS